MELFTCLSPATKPTHGSASKGDATPPASPRSGSPAPASSADEEVKTLRRRVKDTEAEKHALQEKLKQMEKKAQILTGASVTQHGKLKILLANERREADQAKTDIGGILILVVVCACIGMVCSGAAAANGMMLGANFSATKPLVVGCFAVIWTMLSAILMAAVLICAQVAGVVDVMKFLNF